MKNSALLEVEMFSAPIVFLYGPEVKCDKIIDKMFPSVKERKLLQSNMADGISARVDSLTHSVYILWVRRRGDTPILAHEAVHTATSILADRGILAADDTNYEEMLAYTVQRILTLIKEAKDGK